MTVSTRQTTEAPVVRTTAEARQAETGHGVRYVLMFGTTAAILVLAAVAFYYFH